MRRFEVLRAAVILWFFGFALTAFLYPQLFLGGRPPVAHSIASVAGAVLASGCAATLSAPVSLFGQHWRLTAPLVLAFAAPYFLRLLYLDAVARGWTDRLWGGRAPTLAPAQPPPSPYALPSRVAVALAAAARARK
jgi:hypothetical protein